MSEAVRKRATQTCFWAHHSDIQAIRRYIIPSGCADQTAPRFQLEPPSILEGYVSTETSAFLMKRTFIHENTSPTTLICPPPISFPSWPRNASERLRRRPGAIPDPRESNAGLDMLDSLLHDFNRKDNHAVVVS